MKHEHRHLPACFRPRPQGADEPIDLPGLQIRAHLVGQRLDVRRRQHVLGGDRAFGALGKPLRNLGRGLVVQPGQLVEDAARGLAGDDRPGGEGDPLGSVPRRHVDVERGPCRVWLLAVLRRRERNPGFRVDRLGLAHLAMQQFGLGPRDLLSGLGFLVLVQLLHLVAVLDRVFDQLLHVVEVGVAHRGQLDRWQVEVVLDAVFDAHRHQRVQAKLDQRHLPRQVLGLIAHRRPDNQAQPLGDGLTGIRRPSGHAGRHVTGGQAVRKRLGVRVFGGRFRRDRRPVRNRDRRRRTHRGGQHRFGPRSGHQGVVDQREGLVDAGVHLHRGAAGVTGHRRHQPGAVAGHRALLGGGQLRVRKHVGGGGPDQRGQVHIAVPRRVLPDVPPIRQGDMGARHVRRAVAGEVRGQPVLLALEPGRRNVRVILRPTGAAKQRAYVQVVAVHIQLRHGRDHRGDLVLLAGQRRDQLGVMQPGIGGGQGDLHQRHRIGCQLQEGGVPAVDGVADAVGEVDGMPQPLLPVFDVVDGFAAGFDVAALVHRREDPTRRARRLDALQLRGELAQQRVHLRGVAGALGREFAGELALGLGAGKDRVHLLGGAADDRLGGRGVDTHLQIGEVGEHFSDFVGGVFHQRHQPDVLAEQHRLTLAHQVRARADRPGGIPQRQPAGEVGRRGLTQRLADDRGRFGAVMAQQLTQRDLDREDGDLGGLDAVVLRVVQDQLQHRVAQLVLDQGVDLLDPRREHLVAQVQALAHLAMLGAESGEHPDRAGGHRPVDAEHVRRLLARGDRAQALDGLVVVVGQHHRAGTAVVAPRQRPADRFQRGGLAFRALHPVRQLGGRRLLAGRQKRRHRQRDQWCRNLLGRKLFQRGFLEPQRLLGDSGQFGLRLFGDRRVGDDVAELVEPQRVACQRGRLGGFGGRLGFRLGFRFLFHHVTRQDLAHHHVRVGAAEAEAGHPGQRVAAVSRPVGGRGDHLQPHRVEVDVGAGAGEVDRRRQFVVLQRQHHLGHAGRAGRRFQVPDVGFHRTQQRRPIGRTAPTDHPAQRLGLDWVAEDGAGAVRLDVVDGARIDAGVLVGPAQHVGLRVLVGCDQAVGPAVVVDRAAGDHGQDRVAVAAGVVDPLEHQHAAAFGAGVAVGVG
ncbi:Uncharacterised protein [Mycobacterium tuberculosis]|nr:Uncharacterised protein [Mycobacterium tuberculosis]